MHLLAKIHMLSWISPLFPNRGSLRQGPEFFFQIILSDMLLESKQYQSTKRRHQGNQEDVARAVRSDTTLCDVACHTLTHHTREEGLEENRFWVLFLDCNTNKDDILKPHRQPCNSVPVTLQPKNKQIASFKRIFPPPYSLFPENLSLAYKI